MSRTDIIDKIRAQNGKDGLTILRSARFKMYPAKAALFYAQVARNRYTPFLSPITATTLWGHELSAYETSAIGSVYFLGFYDKDVTLFLLKYFTESGDLLDVGSNIGYYTSLFTQIATPEAKIVAFEPTPSTFSVLQKNVGHLPHVVTEQLALSDTVGSIDFIDYGHRHGVFNSTKAQPIPFLKDKGEHLAVATNTLDAWCQKTGIQPSLIKLDTEGTEAGILRAGHHILSTYAPVILLEVGGGEAWSKNANDCLNLLTGHHYSFFELTETGELVPHTRQTTYSYKNLVCIPESKLSAYAQTR